MKRRLADRVSDVQQTALRRMSARCAEMGGINLSQGVCDLPAPPEVKAAAKHAIDDDHAMYTNLAGVPELRTAIAEKLRSFNGLSVDPHSQIAVTVGSAGAFACVVNATLNPGDEVVCFSPFYNYYTDTLKLLGVNIRFVHTHAPDWRFHEDELAAAFNERTRMIIVNTPSNPSGKMFSRSELEQIAALAARYDAWIVTDEIYEYITYDAPHVSIATLPDAFDRTITLSGPSKTYAVTGWRIGYATGPPEVIEKVLVVNDLYYICAPAPLQHGVLAGLHLPPSYYETMRNEYRAKRDMLADTLRQIGFEPFVPQGAFYMMADFGAGRYANAMAAAETILETVGVATVPGAPFYADTPNDNDNDNGRGRGGGGGGGETQLRFCFAKRSTDLEEACNRLRKLVN